MKCGDCQLKLKSFYFRVNKYERALWNEALSWSLELLRKLYNALPPKS